MTKLTASEARSIAHGMWGKVNHTYKMNTRGSYGFSCEGHGGFIVAYESIPEDRREFVEKYNSHNSGIRYSHTVTGKSRFMHHCRIRGARLSYNKTEDIKYYVFEEDSAYAIMVLCGINLKENPIPIEDAETCFYNWYSETNPVVANRAIVEQKRKEGDPDLIVAASRVDNGVKVWTADDKQYIVSNYGESRDEFNTPYLSRCNIVESL